MSFLAFANEAFLLAAGALMLVSFLLWELPRSLRLLDGENEKIIYPAGGRVFDIFLFVAGILSFAFCLANQNQVINTLRAPTFSLGFSIIYISAPALIFLGFLGKAAKLLNDHQSFSMLLVCFLFNFFRTVFYISFSLVFLAVLFFLFSDVYY